MWNGWGGPLLRILINVQTHSTLCDSYYFIKVVFAGHWQSVGSVTVKFCSVKLTVMVIMEPELSPIKKE